MKDALYYIVSLLSENKDKIAVSEENEGDVTTFKITVGKEDMGKVIGKNGKIIRAIRNVIKIPAIKQNKRVNILLEETS